MMASGKPCYGEKNVFNRYYWQNAIYAFDTGYRFSGPTSDIWNYVVLHILIARHRACGWRA